MTMRSIPARMNAAPLMGVAVLMVGSALTNPALAQQPPPGAPYTAPPAKAPAAAKPAAPAKPKAESTASPTGGDSALRQRVEGLEEQLVDLQVQLGTIESLAKSNGAASASPAYRAGNGDPAASGVDAGRMAGLEAQVRTLTQQVQQLSEQVRSLGAQPTRPVREGGLASAQTTVAVAPPSSSPPGWSVSPQAPNPAANPNGGWAGASETSVATLPPLPTSTGPSGGADPASAKADYEQAYQLLLQQDYGAAEAAFDEFLRRHPSDGLAGNAQFWLGETHFVRGQFKAAASAFLKGYRSYGRSNKAPDSLLKLAMSLGRLNQRDEACSALGELSTKYPAATPDVKTRAAAERQRIGCA